MQNKNLTRVGLLVLILLSHIFVIDFYIVNFEYHFLDYKNYLFEDINRFTIEYFNVQANTLAYPFLVGLFKIILPTIEPHIIGRLISILGVILLFISVVKITDYYKIPNQILIIFIITFNPIIWVMGHRATPDLFSACLAIFAMSYLIKEKTLFKNIFYSTLLGFAIVIKPIVGVALIFLNINELLTNKYINLSQLIINNLLIIFLPFLYITLVKYNFDFLISNKYHMSSLTNKNFLEYLKNFLLYLGYVYIFLVPFRIKDIYFNFKYLTSFYKTINIAFSVLISLFFYFFISPSLELNLSFLSNYIDRDYESLFYGISFYVLLSDLFFSRNKISLKKESYIFLLTILFYFVIISFFTPSQRYLIPILPFFIIFLFFITDYIFFFIPLLLYVLINAILISNQFLIGKISHVFVDEINNKGYLKNTCSGVIESHVGYKFSKSNRDCRSTYHIVYGNYTDSLHYKKINLMFLNKELSLIEIDQ